VEQQPALLTRLLHPVGMRFDAATGAAVSDTSRATMRDALALINIAYTSGGGPIAGDHLALFAHITREHLETVSTHELVGAVAGYAAGLAEMLSRSSGLTVEEIMADLGGAVAE
jgi:hypothetical protein